MTTHHHPSEETLAAFASGSLDPARSLVLAAHAESCECCSRWVANLRGMGGLMLEALTPVPMREHALENALAAIGGLRPDAAPRKATALELAPGVPVPHALSNHRLGSWQWIGPGIHRRMVETAGGSDDGSRVFLLRAKPGTRMPDHTHTGTELTLVLSGAFAHDGGRFGAGDLEEADDETDHQPVVQSGDVCICLVAMRGDLKLNGVFGRLIQPFVRI